MTEERDFARERAQECLRNDFNINLEPEDTITANHRALRIENEEGQNILNENVTYVTGFNISRQNTILSIDIRLRSGHPLISDRFLERYFDLQLSQTFPSRAIIDKSRLKNIKIRKIRRNEPKKECSICLCKCKYKQLVRSLPCKHEFHSKCVDEWFLRTSNLCPVCRYEVE